MSGRNWTSARVLSKQYQIVAGCLHEHEISGSAHPKQAMCMRLDAAMPRPYAY